MPAVGAANSARVAPLLARLRCYHALMSRKNPRPLVDRVVEAAEASLADQKYATSLDVLVGIGWLDPGAVDRWRQGWIDCLEDAIQTNPSRVSEAMELFRSWATGKGLIASETSYVARTPQRQALRFSRSGDPAIEQFYRTHWVSPGLSEDKRERLAEKASRAPELVVIRPLKEWTCHRCGGTGDLLIMVNAGPACLRCAGLGDLRIPVRRRRAAHPPRQGEKRAARRRRPLQPEPSPLRAAGSPGRAAGLAGRTGRSGEGIKWQGRAKRGRRQVTRPSVAARCRAKRQTGNHEISATGHARGRARAAASQAALATPQQLKQSELRSLCR